MGPPAGLQRNGWTRNTMKVGDEVIVEGTLAKDGARQANARSVVMANTGKKLGAGSSEFTNP
jgi:hydrogenase maturation factor